jgi:4-oxalocrotonate tautomerase
VPVITFDGGKLSREQKAALAAQLTEVAHAVTSIPKPAFVVFIRENEPDNIGVGGQLLSDRK